MVSFNMLWIFFALFLNIQCTMFEVQLEVFPPDHFLAAPGGNITFSCLNTGNVEIQEIDWRFNGTPLDDLELPAVQANFLPFANGIGRLRITGVPIDFNGTIVQCNTPLSTGYSVESNIASILILNDHLPSVGSLALSIQNSTISISWKAPISSTPLTYCVSVRNSTIESILETQCGITNTLFTYPLPGRSYCDIYLFEVYPVNENGNMGAETIISFVGTQTSPMVNTSRLRIDDTTYVLTSSAPVCNAQLTFVDFDTGETITLGDTDLTVSEINITFTTQQLRQNRHYTVTVTASNVHGQEQSIFQLSTRGVETVNFVNVGQDNEIRIAVSYSRFSSESGALISLISYGNNPDAVINFNRSIILALNKSASLNYVLPFQLFPGRYRMFIYDIEENGTLSNGVGYPAATRELQIRNNSQGFLHPSYNDRCSIHSCFKIIFSKCTLESSTLIGIQIIAQLSDSNEVGKIYANKTTDRQTSASVIVEETGLYQVTIFLITRTVGITNSRVELKKQLVVSDEISMTQPTTSKPTSTTAPGQLDEAISSAVVGIFIVFVIILSLIGLFIKNRHKLETIVKT